MVSDVVNNDVIKKTLYDELVKKGNTIDTSGFIKKADYDSKIKYKMKYLVLLA